MNEVPQAVVVEEVGSRPVSRNGTVRTTMSSSLGPNKGGYFEVEFNQSTKDKSLQVYGEAFDCLENSKLWATVTEMAFKFVSIERVVERVTPIIQVRATARGSHRLYCRKARLLLVGIDALPTCCVAYEQRFEKATRLRLHQNNLASFDQIRMGADLICHFTDLDIDDNPVCKLSILRAFISFTFPHLIVLNGEPITDVDRKLGTDIFSQVHRIKAMTRSLPPAGSAGQGVVGGRSVRLVKYRDGYN